MTTVFPRDTMLQGGTPVAPSEQVAEFLSRLSQSYVYSYRSTLAEPHKFTTIWSRPCASQPIPDVVVVVDFEVLPSGNFLFQLEGQRQKYQSPVELDFDASLNFIALNKKHLRSTGGIDLMKHLPSYHIEAVQHRFDEDDLTLASRFRFDSFVDADGLKYAGSASQAADANTTVLRLTANRTDSVGAAWFKKKQFFAKGFETVFSFRVSSPGGEGFAFVLQNDSSRTIGSSSELGYGGIPNSIAFEFDTLFTPDNGDPDGNHISVHTNGHLPNSSDHRSSLASTRALHDSVELADGRVHVVKISYTAETIRVFIDGKSRPVLETSQRLGQRIAPDGRAWVGFAAANGITTANYDILSWRFSAL
eukprot:TRINITY_DN2618_c0_g1_i1.p1 TRINITY_DN2618_c0_g1~~TRINITY_DN2618_c0_g1_i1.p1  ORF type:complete len:363 (-),score=11.24 TRINITY_DN2618_c0_g1_i1:45-1133(-)